MDVIEEKNLDDIIAYALDYPNMVLTEVKSLRPENSSLEGFAFGIYVGYISGIFFDGFLARNKRYLNAEELSDFHSTFLKRSEEINLKIRAYLRLK